MIEKKLVEKMQEVTGLSGKVFPLMAKQGEQTPFIIYDRTSTNRDMTLTGLSGLFEVSYSIEIYDKTYSAMKSVSNNVLEKIKSFQGQTWGSYKIQSCVIDEQFEDVFDDDDVKWYVTTIEITIISNEV